MQPILAKVIKKIITHLINDDDSEITNDNNIAQEFNNSFAYVSIGISNNIKTNKFKQINVESLSKNCYVFYSMYLSPAEPLEI